jgi:hypothetical protein
VTHTEDELRAALTVPLDPAPTRRLQTLIVQLEHGERRPRTAARRRIGLLSAAAVLVLLVAGVLTAIVTGRGASPAPVTNPVAQPFRYLGPVPTTRFEAGNALRLDPPGDAQARLSPAQAYRVWCSYDGHCASRTTADMTLATVTTPTSGKARALGSPIVRFEVDHVLSYVLAWRNVECPPASGPRRPANAASQVPTRVERCTETTVIDADTGKGIVGDYFDN